jgi:hypothetical protein
MLAAEISTHLTLEAFLANPWDRTEWVDGQLVEKGKGSMARTQQVLLGFSVAVDELIA